MSARPQPPTPPDVDLAAMRAYRLGRVRAELRARDLAGIVLFDPVNLRYATDSSNMQVWAMHNPVRYAFVAADGPVVLFDYHGCEHLSAHLPLVDEVRPARAFAYYFSGPLVAGHARAWASEVDELLRRHGGRNRRLAVDRCERLAAHALERLGVDLHEGQDVMEHARLLKSADEVAAMRVAVAGCQAGMDAMRAALRPGVTENAVWAELHRENIARGGEWLETRLLSSGPRTNPWFQECGERVLADGDLLAFDTDLVGAYGYCADISRTWLCGERRATPSQHELHAVAREQIEHNTALVRPGMGLLEFTERSFRLPEAYLAQRYSLLAHGVGLCDEYPCIYYPDEHGQTAYDDTLLPGMVLCVESYVGRVGGGEGVKLEQQVLVTETGHELLSDHPFDQRLG